MELLFKLGAKPWVDDWYDFENRGIKLIRKNYPDTVIERPLLQVVTN